MMFRWMYTTIGLNLRFGLHVLGLLGLAFLMPLYADNKCAEETSNAGGDTECAEDCLILTLESALSRALNYNRQLINTVDSTIKAQFGIALAENDFAIQIVPNGKAGYVGGGHAGAGMSYGGGFDFRKKFTYGTSITLTPEILKTKEHYHMNLRTLIAQPLFRGFGQEYQLANVNGAKFAFRSARRSLFTAQTQLVIRTIQALYEIVKARKALELNEDSYQRVKKSYEAAKLKEKIGFADALDVYRAETELHQAEDALTSSKDRVQDAEDSLRDILALPLETCIRVEVPISHTEMNLNLEEAINIALERRVEIDQALDQLEESKRLGRLAKNNMNPDLNLVFNYANCGHDELFTRACTRHRESTWGVGFTTSGEFNPLGLSVAYDQSIMAVRNSARGVDQAKANLILEVKKSIRQLERIAIRITLQEKQIHTALSEFHLAQLKFNRGMANNFDVIQAEKTLRSAELAYWGALIDQIVGQYQFLSTLGVLTDKPCIQ